ncbi:MAG: SIR2 family protein [Clostridiaceae bacterium]
MTYMEIETEYREKIIEIMSQTDLSFLIGAGCSLCAGLPHMVRLTELVEIELENLLIDSPENISALKLYRSIASIYANSRNVSIEDFLSEIQDLDAIVQRQKQKGITSPSFPYNGDSYSLEAIQILMVKIKEIIKGVLGGKIDSIDNHRRFCRSIHFDFSKGRKRTKSPVNYFLLNYDTLIEDALAIEGIAFEDGFIGGATAWWNPEWFQSKKGQFSDSVKAEAHIYKLHGSIDWIKPQDSDFPMRIRSCLPVESILGAGEPVVIFPSSTKYKATQFDPFAQMINSFRKTLSYHKDQVLIIIGYGFNDEHINAEIYNGIKNSNGSLSVVIFLGSNVLTSTITKWMEANSISDQILILGKNEVWKKGECIYQCNTTCGEEFEWYKFEYITKLISSEVS